MTRPVKCNGGQCKGGKIDRGTLGISLLFSTFFCYYHISCSLSSSSLLFWSASWGCHCIELHHRKLWHPVGICHQHSKLLFILSFEISQLRCEIILNDFHQFTHRWNEKSVGLVEFIENSRKSWNARVFCTSGGCCIHT